MIRIKCLTCCLAALLLGLFPMSRRIATAATDAPADRAARSSQARDMLAGYLEKPANERGGLAEQPFQDTPLTRDDAQRVEQMLWKDHAARIRSERSAEMEQRMLTLDKQQMKFAYRVFGEAPPTGRSLYLSLHGGGGAPAAVNDQQWENQKRLYEPAEGVYVAPRAPTDTWNLWHQAHIDPLFDRLIEDLVVFENVDPNRVYIMGYSAGGDGVFQLAPRMADRWAAAAMMAGHPNETSPLGLRNIGFTLHMGERDAAYNRNKVAAQWKEKLAALHEADPQGYSHLVQIHAGRGHWMNREDAVAIPWMAKFTRQPRPNRVVWKQDDVRHSRFYWLAVDPEQQPGRGEIVASYQGQQVRIEKCDAPRLTILLHDDMMDLDQPIRIESGGRTLFEGPVTRSVATLAESLAQRGDPKSMYSAAVTVQLAQPEK